jgi:hypothetical protein
MTKRRNKPRTPEQIAADKAAKLAAQRAIDFAAVGLQALASTLPANEDISIQREGQKTKETARRMDAFDALQDGMHPGAFDAARRLERDMRIRRGEHDRGRPSMRVDSDGGRDRTDQAIEAGERVDAVLAKIGERDAWLLSELIYPSTGRAWRETVAYVTGESHAHAQGAVVRSACENLRIGYEALERAPIQRMTREKLLA